MRNRRPQSHAAVEAAAVDAEPDDVGPRRHFGAATDRSVEVGRLSHDRDVCAILVVDVDRWSILIGIAPVHI